MCVYEKRSQMMMINRAFKLPQILGLLVLGGLAAYHGELAATGEPAALQPGASAGQSPPLRFALAASGLPQAGRWKSTPVFTDVNADGLIDLAGYPRLGNGAQVWLGNGAGAWTDASEGLRRELAGSSCGGGLDFADINRDGHLDLALGDHCEGAFVYLGNGRGTWRAATSELNPEISRVVGDDEHNIYVGTEQLAVGDVNEDGFVDLVTAASDRGGFTVYLGDGSGTVWKETRDDGLPSHDDPEIRDPEQGGWVTKFLLHDVDGDGHLDVAASYYRGPRVWKGDGKGRWQPRSTGLPTASVTGIFWGVALGDINEDGRLDLLVANQVNGAELFVQNADGSWQRTPDPMPRLRGGARGVALADLDVDGHLDMVVAGRLTRKKYAPYGLYVLRGDGRGQWTETQAPDLPSTGLGIVWGVAAGDVNRDGRPDVAVNTQPMRGAGAQSTDRRPLPHVQVWLNTTGATRR